MKKLLTLVFAMLLGASLSFAQATSGTPPTTKTSTKTTGKKGTKTKGKKGGKKGKKSSGGTTTTTPTPK
jgi:hypothetical protein